MTTDTPPAPGLTARELAVLDFAARLYPRGDGAHDRDVRAVLGLAMTRYLQVLNALLDDPRAIAYAPTTVLRHRRIRSRGKTPWINSTSTALEPL